MESDQPTCFVSSIPSNLQSINSYNYTNKSKPSPPPKGLRICIPDLMKI